MLKQTARFAALAFFMFAASASPLTTVTATNTQFDGGNPYPPLPPASCLPAPCPVGGVR